MSSRLVTGRLPILSLQLKDSRLTSRSIVKRTFRQGTCNDEDWGRFTVDYSFGIGYANRVNEIIDEDNFYFSTFFPSDRLDEETVEEYKTNYLQPYAGLSNAGDIDVTINCRSSANTACDEAPPNAPPGYVSYAVTNPDDPSITLCDAYFDQPRDDVANEEWCNEDPPRTLDEFETGGKRQPYRVS